MMAMLCRYEAWFLAVIYVACVFLMARRMGFSGRDVRGLTLVYAVFGLAVSAAGWLLYNWMIYGSPLYFYDGPYSSKAQMALRHTDLEVGSWHLSLKLYAIGADSVAGLLVLALTAAGLIALLAHGRLSPRTLPVLALALVVPLMVYTVESGQEPMGVPQVTGSVLNLRYALVVVLPGAMLVGYLVGLIPKALGKAACVALAGVIAVVSGTSFLQHRVVLAVEAAQDNVAQEVQAATGSFLQHHTSGLILMDIVGNERVSYFVVDRTVYEGTTAAGANVWTADLADPYNKGVDEIVMRVTPGDVDAVYAALHGAPVLSHYREIYHNADYIVLGRKDAR
jgi:hypothetical protein